MYLPERGMEAGIRRDYPPSAPPPASHSSQTLPLSRNEPNFSTSHVKRSQSVVISEQRNITGGPGHDVATEPLGDVTLTRPRCDSMSSEGRREILREVSESDNIRQTSSTITRLSNPHDELEIVSIPTTRRNATGQGQRVTPVTQEPLRLSWLQIASVSPHWRCLILTFLLAVCTSLIAWCQIPYSSQIDSFKPCRNGLVWIPATISILFYMLYIIECLHCNIHRDMNNVVSASEAKRLMKIWTRARPVVRWRALSYHYGRSMRHFDNNTGSHILPQTYYMRITSQIHEECYKPYDCGYKDKSTQLTNIDNYSIIKVDIDKYFSFHCTCSEMAYLTQRKMFYDEHLTEDDYIELQETFHLMTAAEVPEVMSITSCNQHIPWFYRKSVYWILSLLCLSWPLRMIIEKKTAYGSFTIHKQFGARCNGTLLMSRDNTSSSYDSKLSDNVYGIIPSYSEALLMSSYTLNGTRQSMRKLDGRHREQNKRSAPDIKKKIDSLKQSSTSNDIASCSNPVNLIKRSFSLYSPIREELELEAGVDQASLHTPLRKTFCKSASYRSKREADSRYSTNLLLERSKSLQFQSSVPYGL